MTVRGTMLEVRPYEIIGEKVYVRKNIKRIDEDKDDGFHGWEYDESEISLEEYAEYIEVLGQYNTDLELHLIEQGQYITELEIRVLGLEVK